MEGRSYGNGVSDFSSHSVSAQDGRLAPARAAREVLTDRGEVKRMVRLALEDGGHYVLLCAHAYPYKLVAARAAAIRGALRRARMDIVDDQVWFRDADWIAEWVNRYPSVAVWVKQRTQREPSGRSGPGLTGRPDLSTRTPAG